MQQFVAAVHGKYRAIHAFEPEPEIWAQLQQNVRAFSKVTCRQIGIGDEVKTVKFSFGGSSSKADKFGEQIVQIEPLEHVLDGVPVTYLKMDIEGMEQSALRARLKSLDKREGKADNKGKQAGDEGECVNIQAISAGKSMRRYERI